MLPLTDITKGPREFVKNYLSNTCHRSSQHAMLNVQNDVRRSDNCYQISGNFPSLINFKRTKAINRDVSVLVFLLPFLWRAMCCSRNCRSTKDMRRPLPVDTWTPRPWTFLCKLCDFFRVLWNADREKNASEILSVLHLEHDVSHLTQIRVRKVQDIPQIYYYARLKQIVRTLPTTELLLEHNCCLIFL